MIQFKPFKAILMYAHKAKQCSCVPYDVIGTTEAAAIIKSNPFSFLSVTHSEALCPKSDPTDKKVYIEANAQLKKLISTSILYEEDEIVFYIYKQESYKHAQIGIVGLTSIEDYKNNKIKKHELTRIDKEEDRINHFYYCEANTEPIFLFHEDNPEFEQTLLKFTQNNSAIIDFIDEMSIRHKLYPVYSPNLTSTIEQEFAKMNSLYIADGHHRCASAYKVGQQLKEENPDHTGNEGYNFNLSVVFPKSQLKIQPYNRLVTDLNDKSEEDIMLQLSKDFKISTLDKFEDPAKLHQLTIYLKGHYYKLELIKKISSTDPVNHLDATIVQDLILDAVFDITDPRTSKDIQFFGGDSLKEEFDTYKDHAFGIFMYPTRIDDIIAVSNNNQIMPPKSTWFEPKLRSGLFIYKF